MSIKSKIEWCHSSWSPIRSRIKEDALDIAKAKGYTSLVTILEARKPNGDLRSPPGKVGPHCERCSDGCGHCYSEANNARCLPSNGTGLPFDRRSRDLVDIFLDEKILEQPLRWRTPKRIFVCSQTDLFADFVSDEMIDRVFAVMAECPQHTFQCLTKRAERMRAYFAGYDTPAQRPIEVPYWPLPNCWLGVSVEDRERKDRIDPLRQTPAAVRFLSLEPLLEDLGSLDLTGIGWCIVGGESGPDARPMELQWARDIVEQCQAASVPVFVKQLGAKPSLGVEFGTARPPDTEDRHRLIQLRDKKGGDMAEWEPGLRVRQMPEAR